MFLQGFTPVQAQENIFRSHKGRVTFISKAEMETIVATSDFLKGVLSPDDDSFAFEISISSFMGFNSPLQQEHFNENYLESGRYPSATFMGSFIEKVNFEKERETQVRAKGMLTIHNISQPIIIPVEMEITEDQVIGNCSFFISLHDYDIKIPRIVSKKIAEDINIQVHVEFNK